MKASDNALSLYFHIPFCKKKCSYCHFYVLPEKDHLKKQLMHGLKLEWDSWLTHLQGKQIETIYFGGGTPSLLGPHYIKEILGWIKESLPFSHNSIEITLEVNPEDVTLELMSAYAEVGINRVSMGIQTLDESLLNILGRSHTARKAIEAVDVIRQSGITNISVDLMYDLPLQTIEHWTNTLKEIQKLPLTHLSLYNLTIEPHTLFFKNRDLISKQIPDAEASLNMYETAIRMLEDVGLKQYEISAFAKEGCHSKHNVGYWIARPFLGLGPSAFSYLDGKRFRNIANLARYVEKLEAGISPVDFDETLDPKAKLRELLAVQIRLLEGVDLNLFQERHGRFDKELLSALDTLRNEGYIIASNNHVKLTKKGILFYDTVGVEII